MTRLNHLLTSKYLFSHSDFGPRSPKDTAVQTYTLTALPRYSSFLDKNQSNTDQVDLNHSNISSWALANMPRTPQALIRRASSFSADGKMKTSKLKARCFKLPMNSSIKEPYSQHDLKSPGSQSGSLTNYQHLQFPNPMSTQKTNNSPLSRIPAKEAPQPDRPMYTQIIGRQQERQSYGNSDYTSNIREMPRSGSSCDTKFVLQGKNFLLIWKFKVPTNIKYLINCYFFS